MKKLKRCPFCGGKAKKEKRGTMWLVKCSECRCIPLTAIRPTEEEAITGWNQRVEGR